MQWWQLNKEDVFTKLSSSPDGLTRQAAEQKLSAAGPNELVEKKRKPAWKIFLNQFRDFMIGVLLAAAIVAGIAGDLTDTIIIITVLSVATVIQRIWHVRRLADARQRSALRAAPASVHQDDKENG